MSGYLHSFIASSGKFHIFLKTYMFGCVCVCVCVGGCVCLAYTSEDFHMKTPRHTEDSTPSEDPKTGPRKMLAKNAENVMFYHLRGVRAPRTSMDFQPYLIYEDTRVLGSISKASRCVCVCGGVGVCVCVSFKDVATLFLSTLLSHNNNVYCNDPHPLFKLTGR